jgi:hypothetical protein
MILPAVIRSLTIGPRGCVTFESRCCGLPKRPPALGTRIRNGLRNAESAGPRPSCSMGAGCPDPHSPHLLAPFGRCKREKFSVKIGFGFVYAARSRKASQRVCASRTTNTADASARKEDDHSCLRRKIDMNLSFCSSTRTSEPIQLQYATY